MTKLPLYQCHKKVRAAKIVGITKYQDGKGVSLLLDCGLCREVDGAWLTRNPHLAVGGYFVHYLEGDDYTAYSPAAPFEGGYMRIEE